MVQNKAPVVDQMSKKSSVLKVCPNVLIFFCFRFRFHGRLFSNRWSHGSGGRLFLIDGVMILFHERVAKSSHI